MIKSKVFDFSTFLSKSITLQETVVFSQEGSDLKKLCALLHLFLLMVSLMTSFLPSTGQIFWLLPQLGPIS